MRGRWAAADGFDPFGAGGGGFQGGFQGFGDLFDTLFGGAAAAGRRPRVPTGADLRYDLRLTFAESIAGAEKEIEFESLAHLRDVRRQRRGARHLARQLPEVQRLGRAAHTSARRCSAR